MFLVLFRIPIRSASKSEGENGMKWNGMEWNGMERKGKERKGKERKGKERKGKDNLSIGIREHYNV